jgi:hypothetical protein
VLGVDLSSTFRAFAETPPRPRPREPRPRAVEAPRDVVLLRALLPRPLPAEVPPLMDDMVIDLRLPCMNRHRCAAAHGPVKKR